MASERIEHFKHRRGNVHFKRVSLHFRTGHGELADRSVGRRGRCMTAGTGDRVFQIQQALFGNADQRTGTVDPREDVLHHSASLIQHETQAHTLLLKETHDVRRSGAVDFFTAGEGKIDVVLRLKALPNEVFRTGENAVEGYFGIQCTPAPHNAVLCNGVKGRPRPIFFFNRHHIKVGHQNCGITFRLTLPVKEKTPSVETLQRAGIPDIRIERRQQADKLLKLRLVFLTGICAGNGSAADEFKEIPNTLGAVQLDFIIFFRFFPGGCKHQRPGENDRCQYKQNIENDHDVSSFTADSSYTGCATPQG